MEEYRFFSFLDILSWFQKWLEGQTIEPGKGRAKSLKKIFLWLKGGNIAESGLNFRRIMPLRIARKSSGGLGWMHAKEGSAATCLEPLK